MTRGVIKLLALLILLGAASNALAWGRWGCRVSYTWASPSPLWATCLVERGLWSLGSFSIVAGLRLEGLELKPYTGFLYEAGGVWAALELGHNWVAFGVGGAW